MPNRNAVCCLPHLLALCLLLLYAGCASDGTEFGATFDPLSVFPETAVWAWDDSAIKLPDDDRLDPESLDRRLRATIAAELESRGYTPTPSGPADYRVSYEVGIHTWTSATEARAFGTLSVLMTEAARDRKVWLGFLRLEIDRSLSLEERNERLRRGVAGMLRDFPPGRPN